jgi:hypothetical protein
MYYILKFNFTKGEGQFPSSKDFLSAFPNSNYSDSIKNALHFSLNNDNELLPVIDWKLVNDGLSGMSIDEFGAVNGPNPIVWLKLAKEIDIEDEFAWVDILSSDYVLSMSRLNSNKPYYFQDHNGYSTIESAEWYADDLWDKMQEIVCEIIIGKSFENKSGLTFTFEKTENEEVCSTSLSFKFEDVNFIYTWLFENKSEMEVFNYYDQEYSDSNNCQYAEENPLIYKLHSLICI